MNLPASLASFNSVTVSDLGDVDTGIPAYSLGGGREEPSEAHSKPTGRGLADDKEF